MRIASVDEVVVTKFLKLFVLLAGYCGSTADGIGNYQMESVRKYRCEFCTNDSLHSNFLCYRIV